MKKVKQPKIVAKLSHTEQEKVFTTTIKENKTQPVKTELNVRLEAFNLITKYEGFHEKPYWDAVRYAYWYWQPAPHKNATITREESKKYVYWEIDKWIKQYHLWEYPKWVQIALLSFRYNLWHLPSWTKRYLDRNDLKWLANRMKEYVYSDGKKLPWLVDRRRNEVNYFYNN